MVGVLVVVGLFFGIVLVSQFDKLTKDESAVATDYRYPSFPSVPLSQPQGFEQALELHKVQTSIAMERELLAKRYGEQRLAVMARLWTRFMGFLTGMALALVGAVFILGKIREGASNLAGQGSGMALSLTSSSPGIILAVVGSGLMALSIVISVKVEDSLTPTYFLGERAELLSALSKSSSAADSAEAAAAASAALNDDLKTAPPKNRE